MFDFGDEFAIESYRVPWLIWVQLIVMILLVLVLFCGFSIFALDRFSNPTSSRASSSSQSHGKDPLLSNSTSKVEGNQSIQIEAETSSKKAIIGDESQEIEESSAKDRALFGLLGRGGHPCNYIDLAKQAILKCFGLGYTSESCRSSKRIKEE